MGAGRQGGATDTARIYATVAGAGLILLGLTGFFYSADFATGEALTAAKMFGLFPVNGWLNLLFMASGLAGIALAPSFPRTYCLIAGTGWALLTAGGFFGAHGGEAIPEIGGLIPVGTANSLLFLALGSFAFAALAAASKRLVKAKPRPKPKVQVKTKGGGIGRPRTAVPQSSRRTIN